MLDYDAVLMTQRESERCDFVQQQSLKFLGSIVKQHAGHTFSTKHMTKKLHCRDMIGINGQFLNNLNKLL